MEEEINDIVSSLGEKDEEDANNKRRKSGLITRSHHLMRVTLYPIHCLISLQIYGRMNAMMILSILLKYPFLMMLAILVAKMPI